MTRSPIAGVSSTPIPRDRVFVAVYVWLSQDDRVLALRRHNTGYMDGLWCPPAGGVDEGESVSECVVRECLEEVGVSIDPESIRLVHTMHRRTPERRVIDLFFSAEFRANRLMPSPKNAID